MFGFIDFEAIFSSNAVSEIIRIGLPAVGSLVGIRIISVILYRALRKKVKDQVRMLLVKFINYSAIVVVILVVMDHLGVSLSAILGAAGVIGIAVGIASQQSLGSIISGLFLVSENTFEVGDIIRVDGHLGIVISIDLLSIKLRTFDNLFIRVPNDAIISSALTNITKYPIRRLDYNLNVAYKEDLEKVREVLMELAKENPHCLDEPAPLVLFKEFNEYSIDILFGVWFEKSDYLILKNSLFMEIKKRFDREGIEIPFPHRTIYTGSVTEPFPVQIQNSAFGSEAPRRKKDE